MRLLIVMMETLNEGTVSAGYLKVPKSMSNNSVTQALNVDGHEGFSVVETEDDCAPLASESKWVVCYNEAVITAWVRSM